MVAKLGKVDARNQTAAERHQRRAEVIKLHLAGLPVMQIVSLTGLSWSAVNRSIKAYAAGGVEALEAAPPGKKLGDGAALTDDQCALVRKLIRQRPPVYYGLKLQLWTRSAVRELVIQKLGVELTPRGIGNYLIRWGVGQDGAKTQPRDRCSTTIKTWLAHNYAALHERALADDADIYWLHKTSRLDPVLWSAPGSTSRHMLVSASNAQGKLMWRVIKGANTADQQVKFLRALALDTEKMRVIVIRNEVSAMKNARVPEGLAVELLPALPVIDRRGRG